jgi:hypothetical protein
VKLLRRAGRPAALCVAWAWSPLVGVAFAASGHLDSMALLLLVAAMASWPSGAPRARVGAGLPALILLAAAIATKVFPCVVAPAFLRGRGAWARAGLLLALLGLFTLPVLLLEGDALSLMSGTTRYALHWESGSLVVRWLRVLIESATRPFESLAAVTSASWLVSRLLAATIGLVAAVWIVRRSTSAWLCADRLMGTFLVLSPTLHPWYLVWMLPFVALRPRASWCWLLVSAPLGYWPVTSWRTEGIWREPAWVWAVQALPFAGLMAWESWRGHPSSRAGT